MAKPIHIPPPPCYIRPYTPEYPLTGISGSFFDEAFSNDTRIQFYTQQRRSLNRKGTSFLHKRLTPELLSCICHSCQIVSVHKWHFCPNSSLLSKFNPRNISYMPVV